MTPPPTPTRRRWDAPLDTSPGPLVRRRIPLTVGALLSGLTMLGILAARTWRRRNAA